jgi:predicted permease
LTPYEPRIPGLRPVVRNPSGRLERDVDDELAFHLESRVRELIEGGMPAETARLRAEAEYGDLNASRRELVAVDRHRRSRQRQVHWLERIVAMINPRLAFRVLWKTPFVTLVAVASLALGIGANAAIFSLFSQFLLRPLPVQEPGRLVNLAALGPRPGSANCGQAGDCDVTFSYPMFRDLQQAQSGLAGIAAHVPFDANVVARNHTLSGAGVLVSGNYFTLLGLQPALGRLLNTDDDRQPGESRVAVLSYEYWDGTFGRDPSILNQTVIVNGQSLTVVGVGPRGFAGTTLGARPQVFVPVTLGELVFPPNIISLTDRTSYWTYLFGRLKPGVSPEQAASSINVPYHAIINNVEAPLQQDLSASTMTAFRAKHIVLTAGSRGQSILSRDAKAPLTLLLAVTAFVLLIACANIANLLLARGAARAGEMALRLSIGGSRGQLVAQLLAESVLLGVMGAALSLVVARVTLGAIAPVLPPTAASSFSIHLDTTILALTGALALVTAVAFGLFPALYATRPDLLSTLRAATGQASGGRAAARWRTSLATGQIALSVALLGAAGLFTKSLANISKVDLGMKVDHVLTFGISPGLNGYAPERTLQLMLRLEESLRQIPGVTGVSASHVPLFAGRNWGHRVDVEGFTPGPDFDMYARYNSVGAGFFGTLSLPLIAGREFTRADVDNAPRVAVVNQAFVKKFNLGDNPVGRRIDEGDKKYDIEIVGLVQDAKYSRVKDEVPPEVFEPYTQKIDRLGASSFYVRTTRDPARLIPAIPRVVAQLDPMLPVANLRTMPEQIKQNVYLDRFISLFSAAFAMLATLLAAIGLYGVLAYTVAQRTREIAVRMALGVAPGGVRLMILRQVGVMTVVGGVVGVAAAVGLGRVAQSLLYQMQGSDPAVLAGALVTLSLVALMAGLIPAIRASRVEPTQALRHE